MEIYVAAGLLGIGIGLSFSAMANLIVQNVRQEQTGVATGMNAVTRTLGGAFGGQLAATLLASNLGAGGIPTSTGFTLSFLMCLIALAAALGFAVLRCRAGARTTCAEDAVLLPSRSAQRARAHRRLSRPHAAVARTGSISPAWCSRSGSWRSRSFTGG